MNHGRRALRNRGLALDTRARSLPRSWSGSGVGLYRKASAPWAPINTLPQAGRDFQQPHPTALPRPYPPCWSFTPNTQTPKHPSNAAKAEPRPVVRRPASSKPLRSTRRNVLAQTPAQSGDNHGSASEWDVGIIEPGSRRWKRAKSLYKTSGDPPVPRPPRHRAPRQDTWG